jgi:hypothetical protein
MIGGAARPRDFLNPMAKTLLRSKQRCFHLLSKAAMVNTSSDRRGETTDHPAPSVFNRRWIGARIGLVRPEADQTIEKNSGIWSHFDGVSIYQA